MRRHLMPVLFRGEMGGERGKRWVWRRRRRRRRRKGAFMHNKVQILMMAGWWWKREKGP